MQSGHAGPNTHSSLVKKSGLQWLFLRASSPSYPGSRYTDVSKGSLCQNCVKTLSVNAKKNSPSYSEKQAGQPQ